MKDMEESKLDRIKTGTKKLIGRTNERIKQRMGRSSDPMGAKDEKWAIHVANFNRQQVSVNVKFFLLLMLIITAIFLFL